MTEEVGLEIVELVAVEQERLQLCQVLKNVNVQSGEVIICQA